MCCKLIPRPIKLSMPPPIQRDNEKLVAVVSTLLMFCREVGLFHYNKLVYLFEYFHIKNFGERFTKEVFCKLPHGPVIVNYKAQIKDMVDLGLAETDLSELREKREVDDFVYPKVRIAGTPNAADRALTDPILLEFTRTLCQKFCILSVADLEAFVYATDPIKKYLGSGFKKEIGGYILAGDCIRIKDYSGPLEKGRAKLRKHIVQHPSIDHEQQKRFAEEFSSLARMRPGV
jgi:hypothetical protein